MSIQSVCRICRREGMKLYLKGTRCETEKCAFERRGYAPGQHGQKRRKDTEYGLQLREKQKVKRIYGLLERQFRRYFSIASRKKGVTGETLLQLLEQRLDNTVYRMGFAESRRQARQVVRHGMILVNGKKVDIPSYTLKAGDKIAILDKFKENTGLKRSLETLQKRGVPEWLEVDTGALSGMFKKVPTKDEIALPVQEQLIVELYSK
ncbi:MAG TPA: 30S ribosomal protein S4 [bacterium]|nr:30S ribosomal protein S4 [bacterium]